MRIKSGNHFLQLLLVTSLTFMISCRKEAEDELMKKIDEYNHNHDGLKDHFTREGYFDMGVAITSSLIDDPQKANLIKRHFNSVTAEYEMKWTSLQPSEGTFNFIKADKIVSFAETNGMKVRGHCLCWHNQVPDWVFKDGQATASKEIILQRLRTHITTVLTHFRGKVYAWDVVNEAIGDGSSVYRLSQWYNSCGEDYIIEAFKAARAADPNAKLFYNDYSAVDPVKREKIYNLLLKLKELNLIDGIGLQGHWNIDYPSASLIRDAFNRYRSLGIELQITELDVSVYSSSTESQSFYTDALAQKQCTAYYRYFNEFRDFRNDITSVSFWGLADDHTWLDNFPVPGRKNYPLLFDVNLDPKPPYFTIIDFEAEP